MNAYYNPCCGTESQEKFSISLSPMVLDFGEVAAGEESESQVVTLVNDGWAAVALTGMEVSTGFLIKSALPGVLGVGQEVEIEISAFPVTVGLYKGWLKVEAGYAGSMMTELAAIGGSFGDSSLFVPYTALGADLEPTGARLVGLLAPPPAGSPEGTPKVSTTLQDWVDNLVEPGESTFTQAGVGAVVRSPEAKMREWVTPQDFGAVGDGVTNDTAALVKMLAHMQDQGKPGHISGGRYLVRPGALEWTFSNTPVVASPGPAGPTLYTAGTVTLVSDGTVDAPLLSIHNDPAAGGRWVHGGHVGALSFEDTSVGGVNDHRYGLELYGVECMHFGVMASTNGLRRDLIHLKSIGDAVTADRWHVYDCDFDGAIMWNAPGYAFRSDVVSQVFCYSRIRQLLAAFCYGAFRGAGAGVQIDGIGANYCTSAAVDIRPDQGTVQGFNVDFMELDANQLNLRIAGMQHVKFGMIRHIYRNDVNTGSVMWPVIAVQLWDSAPNPGPPPRTGQVCTNIQMTNHFRLNDVPNDAALPPTMIDWGFDNNFTEISMENFYSSGNDVYPAFVPSISRFLGYLPSLPRNYQATLDGGPILKASRLNAMVIMQVDTPTGQTGIDYTGIDPVTYGNTVVNQGGAFSGTTFTAPASGLYLLRAHHIVQPNGGDVVRMGFFLNPPKPAPFREENMIVPGAHVAGQAMPIELQAVHFLMRGDRVVVCLYEGFERALLGGAAGVPENNYFEAYLL